jgi:hypothetical protein
MKKLEKKQYPLVAVCGAVICGAGWFISQQMANQPVPKPTPPRNVQALQSAPASAPRPEPTAAAPATGPAMAAATPQARSELARFAAVPPSYTSDPFNPVYTEEDAIAARNKKAAGAMKKFGESLGKAFAGLGRMFGGERVNMNASQNAPQLPPNGEWTPAVLQDHPRQPELGPEEAMGPAGPEGPGAPTPQPEPIARPTLTLTGVIQGENSVAILRGATDRERQVVRVKDRVAGRYVVQSITPDGVLLTASGPQPDRWFLPLGDGEKQ